MSFCIFASVYIVVKVISQFFPTFLKWRLLRLAIKKKNRTMEFGGVEIIFGIGLLFLSLYYYLFSNLNYWEKFQVAGPTPVPFFGNYKDVMLEKVHETLHLKKIYDKYKDEPLIGVYVKNNPRLVIRDPDLIKDVLIKDFTVFPDREINKIHDKVSPFSANLLNLEYKRWKPLRSKLTPIFTSAKLKDMFYLITDCADNFQKYTEHLVEKDQSIECRELTAKFTTDSIGVCVFGLNMSALNDEDSRFRVLGRNHFKYNLKNRLRRALRLYFPEIYDLIGRLFESSSQNQFFIDSMTKTMSYRKQNNARRNDFLDLLMDLKENAAELNDLEITDNLLIAQAFLFFMAGFETSSTAMSNTLYELALNPDIQDELRKEILEHLAKNDGKLTYECIKNMSYLDKIIKEILRKYPTGAVLRRKAASSYTFNTKKGPKVTIPKDTKIIVPVWSIHRDPDIYPNPETFDPERFSEENEKMRHPMNYLPFGHGPHNCIGLRFANFQTKIGVAAIIEKFRVEVCDKTCKEYRLEPKALLPTPIGGLHLKISKI